ncbi:NADPH-dependent FMN reductase [Paenibacillus sp. GCM10027626]|uniref:NADPH-dependent FMN reductase n=1 Tax=Paenibacillus sp. GCM10027626 TaxID=3273411 RepID=UPI00362B2299
MAKVAFLFGSPSRQSRLLHLVEFSREVLKKRGTDTEVIYISDLPAEDLIHANFSSPSIQEAVQKAVEADALVVASPVYKASYTGVLKTFLDLLPQKGLEHLAAFPLFIGGTTAHLLAIDYALKPVLSALGIRLLAQGVYAVDSQIVRNGMGQLPLTPGCRKGCAVRWMSL